MQAEYMRLAAANESRTPHKLLNSVAHLVPDRYALARTQRCRAADALRLSRGQPLQSRPAPAPVSGKPSRAAAATAATAAMASPIVLTFDSEGRAVDFDVWDDDLRLFFSVILGMGHLPLAERAHFGQYKTAQSLYDAVVARYSSPATAALSRLMLPYLFPDLATFATVADLVAHLRTSDARYHAALPT
ncbi:unnamed protein product, partial [Closterium sp. NIES-54]